MEPGAGPQSSEPVADRPPLRILLLEDNADDAAIVLRELRRAGVDCVATRVESEAAFLAALDGACDLILADYRLPRYSALAALRAVRGRGQALPVIVISGTIGEEAAVECLREGATDYLLKDRLGRLGQAVRNAVEQARLRDEQRRTVAALRSAEERYRSLFDQGPHPMWVVDGETLRFLEVNLKAVSHYGYSREEFLAMTLVDIRPPEEVPSMLAGVQTVLAGQPSIGRHRHRTKAGQLLEVSVASRPVTFAGRRALLAVVEDVTERQRLEEQLRQAQKQEAMGRLAGGVAHDFNNLLTTILGYSELIARRLADRPEVLARVEEIAKAGRRGAALTHQLLTFSRRQALNPQPVDLNRAVAGVEGMLRQLIGEDIEIVTRLRAARGVVVMDLGHLEQVIVNLAVNARDAMPAGGRLSIETADSGPGEPGEAGGPGQEVVLAVTDSGSGMDEATRSRIFEPFFTTKEQGRGTGLGLSTVYGIVQQSGGRIEVESEPGRGSRFAVHLPLAAAGVESAVPERAVTGGPPLGSETVLVIEDDPALRKLVGLLLQSGGYAVLAADSPAAAIALAASHGGAIDLLLTDVVLPGMTGPEAVARLLVLRPAMRCLFMSGYTGGEPGYASRLAPGSVLIEKPFTKEALLRKVRAVLDQAGGAGRGARQ
jgi:PAS domain S-box-containing protein